MFLEAKASQIDCDLPARSHPMRPDGSPRVAYLVSEYPAISHTFILREVLGLRARGFVIRVASINSSGRPLSTLAAEERAEAETTFYVKQAGVTGAARAHLLTLLHTPAAYLRGLVFALSLAGTDLGQILFALFYFTEALMLGHWMDRQGLTHVHVHFVNPASTVGLIASHIFPVGFSFTVHGPDEFYDVRGQRLRKKIEGASFVLCIGHFARSQLMKVSSPRDWPKLDIAPLGVDLEVFAQQPFRPANPPFHLLCVGRLVPAKGQHILIAAVGHLVRGGRNVTLRFVGDGPDRADLERETDARGLAGHITFEGNVNQDSIRRFYREADAFVLASFAEGIPVVLMEAMAMGIPCVSTMITGIPELIRDGLDGLLVMPSDDQALAQAITRLIDDGDLRRRLSEAGRRRIAEKYDLNKNVDRLAQLFKARLADGACPAATAAQGGIA